MMFMVGSWMGSFWEEHNIRGKKKELRYDTRRIQHVRPYFCQVRKQDFWRLSNLIIVSYKKRTFICITSYFFSYYPH